MDDLAALLALGAAGAASIWLLIVTRIQPPCRPVIQGSDSFVRDYEAVLQMAETAPNAHLLDSIRIIQEGESPGVAHASGDVVTVDPAKMPWSTAGRAGILIHEGCHTHHRDLTSTPSTERRAMEQENIARQAFGMWTLRDPSDFSAHEAFGYNAEEPTPLAEMAPAPIVNTASPVIDVAPEQPKSWIESWCAPTARELRRRGQ